MRAKCWRYVKIFFGLWILFKFFHFCEHRNEGFFRSAFGSTLAIAESTQITNSQNNTLFFDGNDLDYWREGKKVKSFVEVPPQKKIQEIQPPVRSLIRQSDTQPFDWKNYDNPANVEFWDDGGDYVPPRPLREAVVNPTPENLEKYASWQAKRLVVISEFNQKLINFKSEDQSQNILKNKRIQSSGAVQNSKNKILNGSEIQTKIKFNELSLLYFYQTSCPHCRAAKEIVEGLKQRGTQVTFVQMDPENPPLHAPSVPYNAKFSNQFGITSTPTWIFRRHQKSVRLEGEQTVSSMQTALAPLFLSRSNVLQSAFK